MTTAHYQEAAYEAVVQNEQLLSKAREARQELFDRAFVLPDGRRVFESEDGIPVFDEHGSELDPSTISADEIADARPKYEELVRRDVAISDLTNERAELLAYQQKVDEAR